MNKNKISAECVTMGWRLFFSFPERRPLPPLLLLKLLQVELQLGALQQGTVGAGGLTRAAGEAGKQAALLELIGDRLLNLVVLTAAQPFAPQLVGGLLDVVLLGDGVHGLLRLLLFRRALHSLLILRGIEVNAVVPRVPQLKGRSVHHHDAVLHECLGTYQLVGGGVVHNVKDTDALSNGLRGPRKIAGVQAETAKLEVAAAGTNRAHTAGAELRVRGQTTELGLHALPVDLRLSTGDLALVQTAANNAHGCCYVKYVYV
ncbi:40S ribosomal protein S8 [Trypanosoma rangeli SC58]|uniref:40S ribosomal protein S8 n=1 Tax=Trypanosoma rangeli SC58 TaxID=429131 RepID=A0A061ISJ8_TRYRA|nr:40S ribosomal protein S8 [Trypanosoma rangeli SC58]